MAKVLHITECHYGGVSKAIRKLLELVPNHDHYLLYSGEDQGYSSAMVKAVEFHSHGMLGRAREVRKAVESVQPDYLHLHSSWAGVYGRLTPLNANVIYQPHCYKFDDPTLGLSKKWAFRLAEKLLTIRSDATVVLSPHEERLSRALRAQLDCYYVPNAPSCEVRSFAVGKSDGERRPRTVIMVGRICKQKDPDFFRQVATLAVTRPLLSDWTFRWIGDGELEHRASLESAGIQISGWKDEKELVGELDRADYYVHSATYEGFPISILDAAARGLPIIAREISALEGSAAYQVRTPLDVVNALEQSASNFEFYTKLLSRSRQLLELMNEVNQKKAWNSVYSSSPGSVA
ncbi:glycosyltransferase [Pseudarthrobacter sp. J75]|uniref:glycosyltransferase n=1 Tax=unclassified Pseudarthrobacter TaxID=2647000 RepID=UPI002E8032C2|nr:MULTISPECIES: glycosyltransferase [unclassified Pseudarthrobacter]MEE2524682.1 glycosyltransferase [Pseudarthrobacter sp. J47]MEE2528230.1 glycosyltransferase [Pseudarthrobacter sp. J75]